MAKTKQMPLLVIGIDDIYEVLSSEKPTSLSTGKTEVMCEVEDLGPDDIPKLMKLRDHTTQLIKAIRIKGEVEDDDEIDDVDDEEDIDDMDDDDDVEIDDPSEDAEFDY
jgi:hypothetical protein